jgi:predicted DNA-binding protein
MSEKKTEMIAFRVPETLKKQLNKIADRETRSTSQQVEHFVRQGIKEYLKANPDFWEESEV